MSVDVVLVSQNCNKAANCGPVPESTPHIFIARRVKVGKFAKLRWLLSWSAKSLAR